MVTFAWIFGCLHDKNHRTPRLAVIGTASCHNMMLIVVAATIQPGFSEGKQGSFVSLDNRGASVAICAFQPRVKDRCAFATDSLRTARE